MLLLECVFCLGHSPRTIQRVPGGSSKRFQYRVKVEVFMLVPTKKLKFPEKGISNLSSNSKMKSIKKVPAKGRRFVKGSTRVAMDGFQ